MRALVIVSIEFGGKEYGWVQETDWSSDVVDRYCELVRHARVGGPTDFWVEGHRKLVKAIIGFCALDGLFEGWFYHTRRRRKVRVGIDWIYMCNIFR